MYTLHKEFIVWVLVVTVLSSCATSSRQLQPTRFTTLVFEDDFDGLEIDNTKWYCTEQGLNYNNEDQAYIPDQITVSNGTLQIKAAKRNWSGDSGRADTPGHVTQSYVSGEVNTVSSWRYGKFEVRAKVPQKNQGILSAIWLTPLDKTWPPEIDIVEVLGHDPSIAYFTNHYGSPKNHKMNSGKKDNISLADDFHIYSLTWTEHSIAWYIDSIKYYEIFRAIPDKPMILRISLPVGPDWEGNPTETSVFPQSFIVDWVRVYK